MMEWFVAILLFNTPLVICFTIVPQDVIQAEGTSATFQCQYPGATTVAWIFNGTSIHIYNPPNITSGTLPGPISMLTVLALPAYNETEVWCVATILHSGRVEHSSKGKLTVQATPEAVENLITSSSLKKIVISWEAPFSLNLTSEPDVAYCVDVHNITGSAARLILSDCSVLTAYFVYNTTNPNPRDYFQFTIVPRSNVPGARNGTPSQPIVASFLVHPDVCVESITFNANTVLNAGKLHLIFGFPNWAETILLVYICEVNSDRPQAFYSSSCVCILANSRSTAATANNCTDCSLYPFQNYSVTVQCENSVGISNYTKIISTHKIQNKNIIKVSSALSGTVVASCNITTNYENTITGCLAIITSSNKSELPVYKIIPLSIDHDSLNVTINGLSSYSNYSIALFEALGNLFLPVMFPAQTEDFSLSDSQQSMMQASESEITESSVLKSLTVSTIGNKLAISLGTVSQSTQGIVIIYHKCNENSKSLILSTAYFNSYENDTMVTINVRPGCYHVAIFGVTRGYRVEESSAKVAYVNVGGSSNELQFTEDNIVIILPILGSLLAISIMIIMLLSSGIICNQIVKARKKSDSTSATNIELKRCEAYEVVSVRTQR